MSSRAKECTYTILGPQRTCSSFARQSRPRTAFAYRSLDIDLYQDGPRNFTKKFRLLTHRLKSMVSQPLNLMKAELRTDHGLNVGDGIGVGVGHGFSGSSGVGQGVGATVGDGVGGGVESTVTCGSKLLICGALTSPAINRVDITNMKKAFANINTSPVHPISIARGRRRFKSIHSRLDTQFSFRFY